MCNKCQQSEIIFRSYEEVILLFNYCFYSTVPEREYVIFKQGVFKEYLCGHFFDSLYCQTNSGFQHWNRPISVIASITCHYVLRRNKNTRAYFLLSQRLWNENKCVPIPHNKKINVWCLCYYFQTFKKCQNIYNIYMIDHFHLQ